MTALMNILFTLRTTPHYDYGPHMPLIDQKFCYSATHVPCRPHVTHALYGPYIFFIGRTIMTIISHTWIKIDFWAHTFPCWATFLVIISITVHSYLMGHIFVTSLRSLWTRHVPYGPFMALMDHVFFLWAMFRIRTPWTKILPHIAFM